KESVRCCLLNNLSSVDKEGRNVRCREENGNLSRDVSGTDLEESGEHGERDDDHHKEEKVDGESNNSINSGGFKSVTLQGHRDCVTGIAVGGGFLFSSSYDKTINVWSLQDFSHVQSLRGHEHRVMAILILDFAGQTLCASGDSGSGIFLWSVTIPLMQEPLRKWYEHNDWRYSGVHSLAFSGTGYLYTGSGDKSIKAWSMQDYSLQCTMTGHKSTVSSLVVADGVLYSGSWDGTIRLWWLSDHSPLSVLGDDNTPGSFSPILSLSAQSGWVISSYENGFIKIWRNDVLLRAEKIHNGSIYALQMDNNCFFTGGWDKLINIQELSENESEVDLRNIGSIVCDSFITSLLYWQGKLFVGLSNKEIKVYFYGSQ
ncbi:Myosin heavy chain kinase A, partial [Ananas comosus]